MVRLIGSVPIYYEEYGAGKPVLCIHGYWVDHRLMSGCLEPVFTQTQGYRRIYIDLPGMGETPSDKQIRNSNDTIEILMQFVDIVIGKENFLLAGESYGGYLSMGLINKMKDRIDGVLLICPMVDSWATIQELGKVPDRQIILPPEQLGLPEENPDVKAFMDLAVLAAPEVFIKFQKDILPGLTIADKEYLSNYYSGDYSPDIEAELRIITFEKPACILTGRQDNSVGYLMAFKMLERFPRATFAVLDVAGHNLQIENEALFNSMVKDWLWRVELT